MILRPFEGKSPKIDPTAWVAENAVIIGDVEIGPKVNIWYNVVIRGDTNYIRVGAETNIQDGSVLHAEAVQGPCLIGNRVTIGHNAIIHGCVVDDDVLIGMGSIILSYAKLGAGCVIAAGAVVKEYEVVLSRTIMAGVPAKARGPVTDEMSDRIRLNGEYYLELAEAYRRNPKAL